MRLNIRNLLLLLFGEGILVAAFILLVLPHCPASDVFAVDLVMACLAFALAYNTLFDISGSTDEVGGVLQGLGLRWSAVYAFAVAVTLTIAASILMPLSFAQTLITHLTLLFLLALTAVFWGHVTDAVSAGEARAEANRANYRRVNDCLSELRTEVALMPALAGCKETVDALSERYRYVTGSKSPAAQKADERIVTAVTALTSRVRSGDVSAEFFEQAAGQCGTLIDARKQIS